MQRRLTDIATVVSGYHLRGIKANPQGNTAVIQIKDVHSPPRFRWENLTKIDLGVDPTRYRVMKDDVLFLSRGDRCGAVLIEEEPRNTIVPGYFYIVRANLKEVHPRYLVWYINLASTQALLSQMSKGSNIPFVSKAEFEALLIPLPPPAVQGKIIELHALMDEEQNLLKRLAQKRQSLLEAACLQAAQSK